MEIKELRMKNVKVVLIDIDDTISNFGEVLLKWLNLENETNYKKENPTARSGQTEDKVTEKWLCFFCKNEESMV